MWGWTTRFDRFMFWYDFMILGNRLLDIICLPFFVWRSENEDQRKCTYTWNVVVVTDTFLKQPITNFPGENRRTLSLVVSDLVHNRCRCYARFTTADCSRLYRTGLVISVWHSNHNGIRLKIMTKNVRSNFDENSKKSSSYRRIEFLEILIFIFFEISTEIWTHCFFFFFFNKRMKKKSFFFEWPTSNFT